MIRNILLVLPFVLGLLLINSAYAQNMADSPFERKFGDIKFLDAYFGTKGEKIEVTSGDQNIPFTVVMANVGTHDITGIKGQLSLPIGFASDGYNSIIKADSESYSLAGEIFTLTFFVNIDNQIKVGNYPASIKVDYSRLRESGSRNAFFDFDFKITGDSVINMVATNPFLTSLQKNLVMIEISNDGTAPISSVDIELQNTQGTISSTTQSVTNTENVVISYSNWDIGHLDAGTTKYIEFEVYIPESLKGDTLRAPMKITYFNAHGDENTISRIVDFYVKGMIDIYIYNINVMQLSGKQIITGEIINEGNEDALFGFVTVEPLGDSNIKPITQFIDEIDIDAPVPFNVPIEFEGEPKYGTHDILVTVRYKDDIRDETFLTHEATIYVENVIQDEKDVNYIQFVILCIIAGIGLVAFKIIKKQRKHIAN